MKKHGRNDEAQKADAVVGREPRDWRIRFCLTASDKNPAARPGFGAESSV
jgi:hypothetical protein